MKLETREKVYEKRLPHMISKDLKEQFLSFAQMLSTVWETR